MTYEFVYHKQVAGPVKGEKYERKHHKEKRTARPEGHQGT